MQSLVARSAWILTFVFFANVVFAIDRKDLSGVPAKIEVTGTSTTVNNQHGIKITVELRNPNNRPVAAPSPIEIELQIKAGSGTAENSKITVEQGATSATTELPVNATGVIEVMATNPRLFQGGTLVEVREPKEKPLPVAEGPPAVGAAPGAEILSPPVMTGAAGPDAGPKRHARRPGAGRSPEPPPEIAGVGPGAPNAQPAAAPTSTDGIGLAAGSAAPTASGSWKPTFKLGYYPKQKFRAGDSATVWASLQGDDGAPDDLNVTVMSDAGPLTPDAIKIPKGEHIGQGKLIATYAGSVNVWFDSSKPSGSAPDSMFQIDFGPPIWALNLVPTLKNVNLFDSTDVEVELLDPQGQPVPTDAERQASLSFDKGSGALDSNPVTFQAKSSAVRTKFFPTSPGTIELKVISDGLPAATATVTVTVPYLLILLCAVGSALGGLVAFWTEQAATWHRLVIGLVSGFILYWAFVFGIIHWASSVHAYVINPFSAVALSCIGGWLGTKAITLVLKPLGLQL